MDSIENTNAVNGDGNSGATDEQSQSGGGDSGARPSLSQVKKSWGFRRTTIAKREFMEEIGDLTHSPPSVRRGRSRRSNQAPEMNTDEDGTKQKTTRTARSVIEDSQWSAPSSPSSEDAKEPSETSAGGSFDPSLWQDFGSAFHTAFSSLGGNEGSSSTDASAVPDFFGLPNEIEPTDPQPVEENEVPDNSADTEITQPVAPENLAEREGDYVVSISSQEEDSDELTSMQIKEQSATSSRQGDSKARGGKGGRGKARGRGRGRGKGRGKGKGKGKGRGRAVELPSINADDENIDDDVVLVNTDEEQHVHKDSIPNDPQSPAETESTTTHFDIHTHLDSSDCMILDSDFNQSSAVTHGQFDDVQDEMEGEEDKNQDEIKVEIPAITESEGHDSNVTCFVCSQTHIKRFMICCNSCQEWFHNACVGISETQDWKIEEGDQEYMCLTCTTTRQSLIHLESHLEPDLSFPECSTSSPPEVEPEPQEDQQDIVKEAVLVEEKEEEKEVVEIPSEEEAESETKAEADPQCEMETDDSFPSCTGPGCAKPASPDSVYCGTDCILQHAAITMKTLSCPKVPKSKGRPQRKAAVTRPPAQTESLCRTSKRSARKALEDAAEAEMEEDHAEQEEPSASPKTCDPSLTDVQSTSIPSSNLNTTSDETSEKPETDTDTISSPKQCPEEPSTDALLSQPVTEESSLENQSSEKEHEITDKSSQPKPSEGASTPTPPEKSDQPAVIQAPPIPTVQHLELGALIVKKTTYVIPKKQPASQSQSSHGSQKASSLPSSSETRKSLVTPAPSAPPSRPSQPNNQVRQSIQRSLTTISFKRVSDCEDSEMPESEVVKLVAGIEKEMFDIFRNTDSKYMNKYRTIMFNLKDPRNKGSLYRVVNGEIGPFRSVRMTQKDMQATKAPEPTTKETPEVKVEAAKGTNIPKPEAVKIDLLSLNPPRPERKPDSTEQKKALPAQPSKARVSQPIKNIKMPDILSCMLKDTTSEHKSHLFDLKCKICTGQIQAVDDEEPAKKKTKVSTSREKTDKVSWKKPVGDESPSLGSLDTPEIESPTSPLSEPSSQMDIDSPKLTIVESPASPTLESPASPVIESPASPTQEVSTVPAPKRSYTPVVIPTVSTVTSTRRDPRTAANRLPASSGGNSGPSNIITKQTAPYATIKGSPISSSIPSPSVAAPKALPKSILMKPTSSADPRLYGASSRATASQTPADGDTAQFLAKQGVSWKGFLNMLTVAKFMTKGYLVSGPAENLKADLPDTIQIGGRISPETVWDYVEKLKTSITKELCVIRFHPATEEEEVAYVSLFSYFSSRGRFGVVANISRSIKDVYLVPLGANESIPSILQPFVGPGLEKNRSNLLLALAIVQKLKRPGGLPQEIEEKKLKVNMSKDPMWIPKPPVLYGSDKLDMFKPYDPETAAYSSPPDSPSCIGLPSDSSSSGSVTVPSLLSSIRATPSVSSIASTESTSENNSGKNVTPSSSIKTPLQTILKTLFKGKETEPTTTSGGSSPKPVESPKKKPVLSKVSGSMVDPIVQQYGQKSKVKQVEEDEKEDDFDRPYDPEEEYDPAKGCKMFITQITDNKTDDTALSDLVEDDIAYDPEDETIFEVFQSDTAVAKLPISTVSADASPLPTPVSDSTPTSLKSNQTSVVSTLPTGAVVVSAATSSEQQRMSEELNKQIEEQKRQLKEQEEVSRQQREAVGMFMAHFSVSDTLLSPPTKSSPVSQSPNVQCGVTESKPTDKFDNAKDNKATKENSVVKPETVKLEPTVSDNLKDTTNKSTEQVVTQESVKDCEKYSSAGEIEDSDVAYDPEDESLFDEIQDDVFKGGSTKTGDASSRTGESTRNKSASPNSRHSRRRRLSPKRRSRRERDQRSPSRRSQRRSRSHSRRHRDKDRHKRGERERSRHRTRDLSEYPGHRRKERVTSRHSHGRRRSSSSPRRKHSSSVSPKRYRGLPSQVIDKTKHRGGSYNPSETVKTTAASSLPSATGIKSEPEEHKPECNLVENPVKHSLAFIQNVKTEISEPSISQCNNQSSSSSSQEKKPSSQETWFQDKIESKIPSREIDPPLRDSPESPDPEPPFSKPFSSETVDCVKTENSEEQNSAQSQFVKDENDSLASSDQAIYNPSIGLNIQGTGPERDAVKHSVLPATSFEGTRNPTPDLKDSENGVTPRALMKKGLDIQHAMTNISGPTQGIKNTPVDSSERHVMQQAECLQGSVLNLIKNSIANITDSQTVPGGSEIRNPVEGTKNPSLQFVNKDLIHQSPDVMQHIQIASHSEMAESRTQNETPNQFIRNQLSDRPSHGSKDPISAMQHHNPNRSGHSGQAEQNISYYREALPFLKTDDSISQLKNLDSKLDMKIQASFGGAQLEGGNLHPGTLGSTSRLGNETDPSTSFIGFRGDQAHSKYNERLSFAERGLGKMESQPFRGEADCSGVQESGNRPDISKPDWKGPGPFQMSLNKGLIPSDRHFGSNVPQSDSGDAQKGINREVTDPVRKRPFTQNNWTNLDSQESYKVDTQRFQYGLGNKGPSPNRQTLVNDIKGPRRSDFMGARPEIIPELQSSRNETRRPVFSDVIGKGPEKKGPDIEVTVHGRREPVGPDFKRPGPEWIGPKCENPVHDSSRAGGPDFMGQRLPERRGPSFPGPGIDRRAPNMEGPGNDWRGTGGPNFKGVPERRGSFMEGGEHHSRRPENLDFRRPGYNKESSSNENTGSQSRGGGGPVFRGPAPEGRCLAVQSPEPDRISGHPHFREQESDNRSTTLGGPIIDRRMTGGPNFSRPLNEMSAPAMDSQNSDWKGSQAPKHWESGSERKEAYFEHVRPESIEQGQARILPGLECSKPHNAQGGPHLRGNVTEGTASNLEGPDHNRRGPNFQGPGSNMMGSTLNRTGPGIPRKGRIGQQDDCPEVPNIRPPWGERVAPNPRRTNSRSPPRDSQFRCPEQGRTSLDMEGMQLNRNMAHHNDVEPNRFSRRPDNENRGPDCEGSIPNKQNPRGPSFREPTFVRPGPDMDSRKPDWKESSDCDRARGTRNKIANADLGYDRQNDWGESEPVQEFADYEPVESDGRGRSFRPSRLLRRNIRRPGPNVRGFASSCRGGDFERKWLERRGPRFEEFEGGESSGDVWENSADRSFDTYQDFPDEQVEEIHTQDNYGEWRDPQEEEDAHFSVSGDDWNGPNREEQQHEWTEPDREGPGAFFRGRGGPCNRRQSWGRVRGRGRGSVQQRRVGMEDDWRQHDFKEDVGDHDGSTPWAHRGGFPTRRPTRRPFEMDAPRGRNLRCPEPAYRNFKNDGPESDGRVSDFRQSNSERDCQYMDEQEPDAKGFDREFRRVSRGPIMRHQGPSNAGKRGVSPHGSDFGHPRWDANSEFPESDRRVPDRREREQRDTGQTISRGRRGPGPREGPPAPFNRPVGPGPNREGKSFRDFDGPQNQQTAQPQKHRGALLPTPSDGPLPLSNPTMKNNDGPSMETPQFGPPCNRNRGTSRGRPVDSWFRGRARGRVRGAPAQ